MLFNLYFVFILVVNITLPQRRQPVVIHYVMAAGVADAPAQHVQHHLTEKHSD